MSRQRVFEICDCRFPAEVGAYKNLKVIRTRYTLFIPIPREVMTVREIFAERKGIKYRIITLVGSTQFSSIGQEGPVVEIMKWNGPYWPGKVLYQLNLKQVLFEQMKLE